MMHVELRVDEILKEKGMSVYELSLKTDMSAVHLYKHIRNQTALIRFTTIEKLCEALEVEPGDLFRSTII